MKNLILPVVLGLASTMAFAAPPAKSGDERAKGVDRATTVRSEEGNEHAKGPRAVASNRQGFERSRAVRSEEAGEHANGPRLVRAERSRVRRTSVKAHRTRSVRRASIKEKTEKE